MLEQLDIFSPRPNRIARDTGIIQVESNNYDWVSRAREIAHMLASSGGEVTIEDVLKLCPRPEWVHPNACGAVMRSKNLKLVRYTSALKTSSNARKIGVYEWVDA